jgi:hypothetical protein
VVKVQTSQYCTTPLRFLSRQRSTCRVLLTKLASRAHDDSSLRHLADHRYALHHIAMLLLGHSLVNAIIENGAISTNSTSHVWVEECYKCRPLESFFLSDYGAISLPLSPLQEVEHNLSSPFRTIPRRGLPKPALLYMLPSPLAKR